MNNKFFVLIIAFLVIIPGSLSAQYFGQNKVQYELFDWKFLQSEHFDIYFTTGGVELAAFVAEIAEASYKKLKADFRYDLIERITIIAYNSHNDFGQTNVDLSPPEESVGGFTEFLKNRVVIPYEGDWEKFRHVINHELTHAVMLQMVYGAGVQSILTGVARLRIPLWFTEGLAEYESLGWDTESDMFMRDAALNIDKSEVWNSYTMYYKGGQSILHYLSEKYGAEKIGELLGKIKVTKSFERGLKESIGVETEDLIDKWFMYLKRNYWPDIADRKEPDEFAKRLTDHLKTRNFVNSGPALSPKGDKIAFLSDRSDYFDIYLMSTIDGKILSRLVHGQRSGELEELHWLRAGISWSPDGKKIIFAAKAGDHDALHIVHVKKKEIIQTIKLDLDGVFNPAWSPLGDEIAFMGAQDGQGDIYIYNLKTNSLRQLTNDVFSDLGPSWSPDGKQLVFTSDRGDWIDTSQRFEKSEIYRYNFYNDDVYLIDSDGRTIKRVTNTAAHEGTPVFSPDGDRLAYTSDRTGINNIYIYTIDSGIEYPITNVMTGIFHLSWQGENDNLAFTSYYKGGYDIYLLKNPLKNNLNNTSIKNTNFVEKMNDRAFRNPSFYSFNNKPLAQKDTTSTGFSHFVFGDNFKMGKIEEAKEKAVMLDSSEYKLANGGYKINKYRIKFSPDVVSSDAGYSQFYGLQGSTYFEFSDVLGDHRISLYTNLFYDIRNSNFQGIYYYLPRKTDYGFGGFHYAYYLFTRYGLVRDRNFGFIGYMSRPFSRYSRVDLGLNWLAIDREYLDYFIQPQKRRNFLFDLSWINDTSIWYLPFLGPNNGSRSMIGVTYSPGYSDYSLEFVTVRADWRKYLKIGKEYNFTFRLSGGASLGKNPQQFFLGGTPGWLNYDARYGGIKVDNVDEIYFSSFEMPLRGAKYYEQMGNRFMLTNIEFRFPFIRYFLMGWPLPINIINVRGAVFTDIGSAWQYDKFKPFSNTDKLMPKLDNLFMGYGFGARMIVMNAFILRFDAAWKTDLYSSSAKPLYYFSLGSEF